MSQVPRLIVTYIAVPLATVVAFEWEFWRYLLLINAVLIAIDLDRKANP